MNEDYIQQALPVLRGNEWKDGFGPMKIPFGKCFAMGDNRDVSLDSRSPDFALVDESSIIGKALYVLSSDRQGTNIR